MLDANKVVFEEVAVVLVEIQVDVAAAADVAVVNDCWCYYCMRNKVEVDNGVDDTSFQFAVAVVGYNIVAVVHMNDDGDGDIHNCLIY